MKHSIFVLLAALSAFPLAAQSTQPFADQVVFGGLQYNQNSAPQFQGFAGYAKLVDGTAGIYSYTRFVESSVKLKPQFAVQTQTETGFCAVTDKWGSLDVFAIFNRLGFTHVFACATGGIAAAASSVGASGSGTLLLERDMAKGWKIGIAASPSYSAVTGKVSYPIGIVFGWGR